jgi:hypothetical protein
LADRVDVAVEYALSQRNNHGLGETAALFTLGHALPHHPQGARWRRRGRELFVRQVLDQFDEDGCYVVNAHNYARLALRYASIVLHSARHHDDPLPDEALDRLRAAVRFLWQQQDGRTGRLPVYGANDGANQFALSTGDYGDFRPALQLLHWQLTGERLYGDGPWDEEIIWYGGTPSEAPPSTARRDKVWAARSSGYYALRSDRGFATVRCHTHVSRPSQADMLHLDLWVDGVNVFGDGGSYGYNDGDGVGAHLKGTAGHNTVVVDGKNQMPLGGPFLYVDWTRSRVHSFGALAGWDGQSFDGEHHAWLRSFDGVVHRRRLLQRADSWAVIDDVEYRGGPAFDAALRWHLADELVWTEEVGRMGEDLLLTAPEPSLVLQVFAPAASSTMLLVGPEHSPETVRSPRYGQLEPCSVVLSRARPRRYSLRWITTVGPARAAARAGDVVWEGLAIPRMPSAEPRPLGAGS